MKTIRLIMTAAAVIGMAAPALADVVVKDGRPLDLPRREVRFADLNLDTQEGIVRLNTRIAAAVRTVCGTADLRSLYQFGIVRACRQESLERAFADRDAIIAARMAARGQPEKLAKLGSSIAIAPK